MKQVIKCSRCNGKGFLMPNQYRGRCYDGQRHLYTLPSGKRLEKCLRCGEKMGIKLSGECLDGK